MRQPFDFGELRERVTVRRYVEAIDDYGTIGRTATALYADIPAHVRPMSGNEQDRGQQTEARANYLVVIRYRGDLTEKDTIIWRSVEYDIRAILDRGPRSQFLELQVERGAA